MIFRRRRKQELSADPASRSKNLAPRRSSVLSSSSDPVAAGIVLAPDEEPTGIPYKDEPNEQYRDMPVSGFRDEPNVIDIIEDEENDENEYVVDVGQPGEEDDQHLRDVEVV